MVEAICGSPLPLFSFYCHGAMSAWNLQLCLLADKLGFDTSARCKRHVVTRSNTVCL